MTIPIAWPSNSTLRANYLTLLFSANPQVQHGLRLAGPDIEAAYRQNWATGLLVVNYRPKLMILSNLYEEKSVMDRVDATTSRQRVYTQRDTTGPQGEKIMVFTRS